MSELHPMLLPELNSSNILQIKQILKTWKPKNAHEAIVMRHLVYLIENNAKSIKKEIASMLDRCTYCDNERVDAETGLTVIRKLKRSTSVYEDEELASLEAQKAEIEAKIAERKTQLTPIVVRDDGYDYSIKT